MTVRTGEKSATLSPRVAAEIRAEMGRQMVRQSQLARQLGENDTWLSMRLRGLIPIDLNELQRIADALSVSVKDLLPTSNARSGATSPVRVPAPRRHVKTRPNGRSDSAGPARSSGVSTMRRRARLVHDQ